MFFVACSFVVLAASRLQLSHAWTLQNARAEADRVAACCRSSASRCWRQPSLKDHPLYHADTYLLLDHSLQQQHRCNKASPASATISCNTSRLRKLAKQHSRLLALLRNRNTYSTTPHFLSPVTASHNLGKMMSSKRLQKVRFIIE